MKPPAEPEREQYADKLDRLSVMIEDAVACTTEFSGLRLRPYQAPVAQAIIESVSKKLGLSIVVMFPRQSGKNELQAQIEAYLLKVCSHTQVELVKVSPTWRPQSINAMRRLQRVLAHNCATADAWQKEAGYILRVGAARITFLSGAPESNIVGATANLLLEVDEAQDVQLSKYDGEIAPMAASSNATRVFWGTAWTSNTLLARELRLAQAAEQRDGRRRVFIQNAEEVAKVVPAYGVFVAEQVSRLGRNHPLVKTQYFSEEIDGEGGMFDLARQALMQGNHPTLPAPDPSRQGSYVFTLDVAGEDEAAGDGSLGRTLLRNPGRDATALTIFELDAEVAVLPLSGKPVYRTVSRQQWVGIRHAALFSRLLALIDLWQPAAVVVDATGVGQTLASFLVEHWGRTIPFTFTAASKSKLGWDFLALIEAGRYKEHLPGQDPTPVDRLQAEFWQQAMHCQYSIVEGPARQMRWGVPDGQRDLSSGELVHDDLLVSAALVSVLEGQAAGPSHSRVIQGRDPLTGISFKEF